MIRFEIKPIKILDLITIIYFSYCLLQLNNDSYMTICMGLLCLWLLVAWFCNAYVLKIVFEHKAIVMLLSFFAIAFIYASLTSGIIYGLKYSLTILIKESPFIMFLYYYHTDYCQTRLINNLVTIVLCVLCVNMLKLIAIDPNAARIMAAYRNVYSDSVTGGGYQLAYVLCIFAPMTLFFAKKTQHKIVNIILFIFLVYTLVKCSYTIALLLFFAQLVLIYSWNENMNSGKRILVIFLAIVALFLFFILRQQIGMFISNQIASLFDGSFIERRMREFGDFIAESINGGNGVVSRFELYKCSINSFVESPIIGVGYITKFNADLEMMSFGTAVRYVGQHSTVFDGFARYGILFIPYIVFYIKEYKFLYKATRNTPIILITAISLFVIKMLNVGDAFGLAYVAAFALPTTVLYFQKRDDSMGTKNSYTANINE